MLRFLFFDAAGTLFHLPRGVGGHYREVALRHGLDLPAEALEAAFRRAWKEAPAPPTTRQPRVDDDKGWWQALVWRIMETCVVPSGFAREVFFEELYGEFTKPGVWELYEEVRETLAALRPRFRLGIISNFDGRLRAILRNLEIAEFFEIVVISSETGADKPDPWIFQHALAAAGLPAAEAMHIGDDPVCDWEGAEAAGLRSFRLDRPRVSLRDLLLALD